MLVEISLSYFAERQLGLPGFTGSILQKVQQEIDVKAWIFAQTSEIQLHSRGRLDQLMLGGPFAKCPDVMPMAFEFIFGASPWSLGTVGGPGVPEVTLMKIGRPTDVLAARLLASSCVWTIALKLMAKRGFASCWRHGSVLYDAHKQGHRYVG